MPVIILTAHGSIPDAVTRDPAGCVCFLTKPVDKDALYKNVMTRWNRRADDKWRWREAIVTRSPLMERLLEQAGMVAQSDVSVLINGQSGTGKEIIAQAIHNASPRRDKPFVAINCGAAPRTAAGSGYSATRAAPLPARSATGRGYFRPRKAARCFWMRSAICRWRYR